MPRLLALAALVFALPAHAVVTFDIIQITANSVNSRDPASPLPQGGTQHFERYRTVPEDRPCLRSAGAGDGL